MDGIPVAKPNVNDREIEAVAEVLGSGHYVSGPKVKEFEDRFADYLGVEHGVAVNSGTSALHLALLTMGVGPGDEVIVPPMTFFATIEAVIYVGAKPVFADIDPVTYCITPETIGPVITSKTAAIIPVDLFGHPAPMIGIENLAVQDDIWVLEDAAQAHGAAIDDWKCGSFGDAAMFSFFATKNLTTGEGGFIATDDKGIADECRLRRSHGMTDRNTHRLLGYNYRMTEMEAAIGLIQLEKLDAANEERNYISHFMLSRLQDTPGITVALPESNIKHAWFWTPILLDPFVIGMSTLEFRQKLSEVGIETRHRYTEPLYRQPIFGHEYDDISLPIAEKLCGNWLGLPNYPGLTKKQMNYIVDMIHFNISKEVK